MTDLLQSRPLTLQQTIALCTFIITATLTYSKVQHDFDAVKRQITLIKAQDSIRFHNVEQMQNTLNEKIDQEVVRLEDHFKEKLDDTNRRLDTKTKRNEKAIEGIRQTH